VREPDMKLRFLISRPLVLALVLGTCLVSALGAQSEAGRARIALYEPAGQKQDGTLTAVLSTMADSVEMSLVVLDRYEVRRLASADPVRDLDKIRAYCEANRIDQAILGSGSARTGGGYDFRLVVYNRQKDAITVDRKGSSTGALDMFDVTDALVTSLLDGLSGTHLLFGSLAVQSSPAGAMVAVNGKTVGTAPLSLRGLPVGAVEISGELEGHEAATATLTIVDGSTTNASLSLPRSTGTLALVVPKDAMVQVKSAEIGQKELTGPGGTELPTGEYEVQASCPGLPAVSGRVTIIRGASVQLLPWKKGYLALESDPEGVSVVVDDQDKGKTPVVVEVEPETLHRVEMKKEKYKAYHVALTTEAGDKRTFSGSLTFLPGTIKVETSIAGADVELDPSDDSADTSRTAVTPAVFGNILAGNHVVRIANVKVGNRIYTVGDPVQVVVSPDEETIVSKTFEEGVAHLTFADAPPGSIITIDGKGVDSESALGTGIDVPAGRMEVSIQAPGSQSWVGTVNAEPGRAIRPSIDFMASVLPRRTITLDGKPDSWAGIEPLRGLFKVSTTFMRQTRFAMARVYMARDEKNLYWRVDFGEVNPILKPPKGTAKAIACELSFLLDSGKELNLGANYSELSSRQGSYAGVYDPSKRQWSPLTFTEDFRNSDTMLVARIGLDRIFSFLKKGIIARFKLGNDNGSTWEDYQISELCVVDLSK